MNHNYRISIFKKISQDASNQDEWDEEVDKCPNCGAVLTDEDDLMIERAKFDNIATNPRHGCSNCMQKCTHCDMVELKSGGDTFLRGPEGELYCQDCWADNFSVCEECHTVLNHDDVLVAGNIVLCEICFNRNYAYCDSCSEVVPLQNVIRDTAGNTYCEECAPEGLVAGGELPPDYSSLQKIESISFNKFDRVLNQLKRLLPISVKDLNKKHPRLAAGCKDLIAFSGGRDLTSEIVERFENEMPKEEYPVRYSTWRSLLQRSVMRSDVSQLVLNVLASEQILNQMKSEGFYDLFELINNNSRKEGHPCVKDQMGWIRVELHKEEKYLLIDEIQTDHMNAIDRIKSNHFPNKTYTDYILNKQDNMTVNEFDSYLNRYKSYFKNFADIAIETAAKFSRSNGFEKIYYHTYESGKRLKNNAPPKSLYTTLPERHFFEASEDRPFGLEGQFLTRTASEIQGMCNTFYLLSFGIK